MKTAAGSTTWIRAPSSMPIVELMSGSYAVASARA